MAHDNRPEPSPAEVAQKVDKILADFDNLGPDQVDALARDAEAAEAARRAQPTDAPTGTPSDYRPARFPYITAYCNFWGSFLYYRRDQHALAARDGVPDYAYRQDRWGHLSVARRDKALTAEKQGTAIVIRDADGNPQRVWYLIDYLTDADLRATLDRDVDQIRAADTLNA